MSDYTDIKMNSFMRNVNNDNKYIDNDNQDPYWLNAGTERNETKKTININTGFDFNKTFEISLDNPYSKNINNNNSWNNEQQSAFENNQEDYGNNNVTNNELMEKLNSFSFDISDYVDQATSNLEGIGKKHQYEINFKVDQNEQQPLVFNNEQRYNESSAFLANTTLPAIIPVNEEPQSKSLSLIESGGNLFAYNQLPSPIIEKKRNKSKVITWILVTVFLIVALFWLVFWLLEFLGVTDFVWWNGFDPVNN